MLLQTLASIIELISDTLLFWLPSKQAKSRANGITLPQAAQVLDSTPDLLLTKTKEGLHLVSRHQPWKTRLTKADEQEYRRNGNSSLAKISKRHQNPELILADG